jgi:hypothetical protein
MTPFDNSEEREEGQPPSLWLPPWTPYQHQQPVYHHPQFVQNMLVQSMDTVTIRVDPYIHRLAVVLQRDDRPNVAPPTILLDTKQSMKLIELLQASVRELEQF